LNDFEACGYGVPALQPEDLLVLNDVPARQKVCAEFCGRTRLHENPSKSTATQIRRDLECRRTERQTDRQTKSSILIG